MRFRMRGVTLVATVAALGFGLVGTALPAGADPVEDALYMSNATISIAEYNAAAIMSEGGSEDNISCTIGGWAGAATPRIVIPNVNTTHGQDVGTADGDCADLDPVNPPSFNAYLEVNFEYLTPGTTNDWVEYNGGQCTRPSVNGHAIFAECTRIHQFPNPSDPIQDYARRVVFNLGVFNPDGTKKPAQSTRAFGPLPPRCSRLTVDTLPQLRGFCFNQGW